MDKALLAVYEEVAAKHHASDCYSWDLARSPLESKVRKIADDVKPDADGVYQASSPWEAAIFLADWQVRESFVTLADKLILGQTIQAPKFKWIFRGQKARYTNFEPSAWRLDAWTRAGVPPDRGQSWLSAFCLLMKLATEVEANISLQAWLYHGAAQHYQIPTDLLDWTVDPFVAVWFAHSGMIKKGDRGKVFCIELENEDRTSIILPPPFVKRLFRQRGLFHYTTEPNKTTNHALYKRALKLEFPLASSWHLPNSFPYRRDNQLTVPDSFILDTREAAKRVALSADPNWFSFLDSTDQDVVRSGIENARDGLLRTELDTLARLHGKRFSRINWEKMLRGWIVETNNYINWLCTLSSSAGQALIVPQSVESMVELNRDALHLYAHWLLRYAPASARTERGLFAKQLMAKLLDRYPELSSSPA
jgi:hypothetical protein